MDLIERKLFLFIGQVCVYYEEGGLIRRVMMMMIRGYANNVSMTCAASMIPVS